MTGGCGSRLGRLLNFDDQVFGARGRGVAEHQFGHEAHGEELGGDGDAEHAEKKERALADGAEIEQPEGGEVEQGGEADSANEQGQAAEEVAGAAEVAGGGEHGEQIEESVGEAGPAEFGFAVAAGVVAHGDFGDAEALAKGQDGDVAVHFTEEVEVFDGFPSVGFEAAVEVVEGDAGEPGGDAVEEEGGEGFGPGVLAVAFPAGDDVVALVEPGEEVGDFGGVVLEVGIDGDDDGAAGEAEAGVEGGGFAEVTPEADGAGGVVGVGGGKVLGHVPGAVTAAVIDEEDFPSVGGAGLEDLGELVVQGGEGLLFLEKGDDGAERGGTE